ncbi:regulator of deoxyribodipyrimidine photo-lyase PHR1 [Drechmeria coniospora]|uniref:[histone H3]-trimethyl-L-lysine(9) demethylase n=1 Tax=Drechmeria coniospora TaxID=98403 RepID=A0A151GG90_DRECN|nr:regulator of deoxyribodipyrimidine photo-lyase PHR1 [Drechmeria coniospora]KYK56120.1 regulator of deoxyribodipyrimidine photo-lyase PHR1 [Drechmeria coniospora]
MSADTVIAPALVDAETGVGASDCSAPAVASLPEDQIECAQRPAPPPFLHSPPDSYNAPKSEASDSELSDLEDESILDHPPVRSVEPPVDKPGSERQPSERRREQQEEEAEVDIGEVLPDHWSGAVPVFRPTMFQFKDFQRFMKKVDGYGMKSGIIKIIPPREWKDAQPPLDELVKHVRVREPIKQDIMGSNGTYRQVNILHGRSYNLPQWRQLCEQSEHQPPARRGERRINADKARPARRPPAPKSSAKPSTPKKRGRGRPSKGRGKHARADDEDRPMTPVSPKPDANPHDAPNRPVDSIEKDPDHPMADDGGHDNDDDDDDDDGPRPSVGRMGISRPAKAKMQSVSARRKCARREGSAKIDEAAFKDFDYRMDVSDYTPERCEELERAYWRTLTYASPLYGADMMGTLFDDRTESWGLNRLPNLLDVLGTKIPGVNTAYLYLGMWKATFAWHLEDVDLYSINYLHFGAPKQWYSISQADARRFEAAMKNIWPADAKACSQFLRHKGFLISPQHLLTHYNIKVNKVLSYPGEFVVTYPYGYHSGYNLGYNCAEAVNFALDSWLEMGKIAKKCECAQAQDSVWINVYEIERKLRGEETEYEETDDDDDDDDDDEDPSGLPTPPASLGVKFKGAGRKRKRGPVKGAKVKKIKLRLRAKAEPPCCLCPHGVEELEMLPTDHGRQAHRLCALYIPETYIDTVDGKEVVCNVAGIQKGRTDLKCLFCRSKRGACFQCSHSKCTRAYHATCAAAIGCFVEEQQVPIFGDDGTEYKEQAFAFSCRFHRTKRDKRRDGDALEADEAIRAAARALRKGDIRQFQFYKGEIFAGVVVENRPDEETVLIRAMPNGGRVEVEWKWLLLPDPADFRLPKASAKAVPLPASKKAKDKLNAKRLHEDKPRKDDVFVDGCAWAEFHVAEVANKDQSKVDLSKPDQIWHYLGRTSTDARAQYTDDPANACHNVKSNFLDTLPKAPKPKPAVKAAAFHRRRPSVAGGYSYTFSPLSTQPGDGSARPPKPYLYKPRTSMHPQPIVPLAYQAQGVGSAAPTTSSAPLAPPSYMAASQQNLHHRHHTTAPAHESRDMYSVQKPGSNNAQGYSLAALQNSHHAAAPIAQGRTAQPTSTWQPAPSAYQQPAAPQQRPAWHVYSSVHQKYPFFQVNHNRDPSKYRTPYSPWGGFVNGYERNPRAPMVSTQTDGLRKCSTGHAAPLAQPHAVSGPRYPPPHRELEAASQPLASQGLMRPGFGQQSFVMSEMAGQQPRPSASTRTGSTWATTAAGAKGQAQAQARADAGAEAVQGSSEAITSPPASRLLGRDGLGIGNKSARDNNSSASDNDSSNGDPGDGGPGDGDPGDDDPGDGDSGDGGPGNGDPGDGDPGDGDPGDGEPGERRVGKGNPAGSGARAGTGSEPGTGRGAGAGTDANTGPGTDTSTGPGPGTVALSPRCLAQPSHGGLGSSSKVDNASPGSHISRHGGAGECDKRDSEEGGPTPRGTRADGSCRTAKTDGNGCCCATTGVCRRSRMRIHELCGEDDGEPEEGIST